MIVPPGEAGDRGLVAIDARSPSDVWIADDEGAIRHWDGRGWSLEPTPLRDGITALAVDGTRIWIAGRDGALLYREL